MKWAQTKEGLYRDGVNDKEGDRFFKVYNSKDELEAALNDPTEFVVWTAYDIAPIKRKAQRKYEIFCGGFLHYHDFKFKKYDKGEGYTVENGIIKSKKYDEKVTLANGEVIESKDFEHTIYIKWLKEDGQEYFQDEEDKGKPQENKKEKNHKVILYINPTPGPLNADPPPPPAPPPPESND